MKRGMVVIFFVILIFVLIIFLSNRKPTIDSPITGTTISDFVEYQTRFEGDDYNEPYGKLDDLFESHKELFTTVAEFITEKNIYSVSYDRENNQLSVGTDGEGNMCFVGDIFSDTEQGLFLECFDAMAQISPNTTRLWICKIGPGMNTSIEKGIEFNFRSKAYVDYGFLFTDENLSYDYVRIDDNWYKFFQGLV